MVAYVISRVKGSEVLVMAISTLQSDLMSKIQEGYETDISLKKIIEDFERGAQGHPHFSWSNQL